MGFAFLNMSTVQHPIFINLMVFNICFTFKKKMMYYHIYYQLIVICNDIFYQLTISEVINDEDISIENEITS